MAGEVLANVLFGIAGEALKATLRKTFIPVSNNIKLMAPFMPGNYVICKDTAVRETLERVSPKISAVRKGEIVQVIGLQKTSDKRLRGELVTGGFITLFNFETNKTFAHLIVFEGYLLKKGGFMSKFQKRYFRITNNCRVNYYLEPNKSLQGSFYLHDLMQINDLDNCDFEVKTSKRTWVFRAETEHERSWWKTSFGETRVRAVCFEQYGLNEQLWQGDGEIPLQGEGCGFSLNGPPVNTAASAPVLVNDYPQEALQPGFSFPEIEGCAEVEPPRVLNQEFKMDPDANPLGPGFEHLSDDWEEAVDPGTGKVFYINHVTCQTQWERPQCA